MASTSFTSVNQSGKQAANVQPKLTVNAPGDRYECEADAMADRVMRMPMGGGTVRPTQGLLASSVQRKCAHCDQEEKMKKPLMRNEQGGAGFQAPQGLASSLGATKGGGSPLPDSTRGFMENAFSTDFSRVRVHADGQAAAMSQGIQARAFTHGSDVYFNSGEYQPGSGEGRRLLAHELTHVVQQGGGVGDAVQRAAISPLDEDWIQRSVYDGGGSMFDDGESSYYNTGLRHDRAGSSTMPYREATEMATCTRILGEGSYETCYQQVFGRFLNPYGAMATAYAQYMAGSCSHTASALTWADFQANPPRSRFSAETHFAYALHAVNGQQVVRAEFHPQQSWVKAQFANPTNRAVNGCAANVTSCETFFDQQARAGLRGSTFNLRAPAGCAASVSPNTSLTATTRAECSTILGTECDRVASLESLRLLRHEQYHYKLACELARKGAQAIYNGRDANQALISVRRNSNAQTRSYDSQTVHGCNQASQTAWEGTIDNGLPAVTI